jgi:hypothetical protein
MYNLIYKRMLKKRLFLGMLCLAVILTACKKSKDETPDPFNEQYNGATIEQNKATLEDNGIHFVDQIDQIKDVQAIPVIIQFVNISGNASFTDNLVAKRALAPMEGFTSVKEYQGLKKLLKSIQSDGPANLAEGWDSIVGRYTYDTLTKDFVKSALSNEIIIEFPGLESDKTNTAAITINNFTYITLVDPVINIDDGTPTEFPTSIHVGLSYSGKVISTWDYLGTYQTDGMPLTYSSTLIVDDFSFNTSLTHNPSSDASITYTFKHADQILLQTHAEGHGDWTSENIDANTQTNYDTSYVWQYNSYTQSWEQQMYVEEYSSLYFENVVKNANAYIQIMNIKVAGQVDFNQLLPALRTIDDSDSLTDHQYAVQEAAALNLYAKLVVVTLDKDGKIATAEAYAFLDDYDDWRVGIRFVFQDGSKIDAETYFSEGFDSLIESINNVIADINDEHDINIKPINN